MTESRVAIGHTPEDRATREEWGRLLAELGHLYRYVSVEPIDWLEDAVLRSKLFLPRFRRLNDPFDGNIEPDYSGTPDGIRAFWVASLSEDKTPIDESRIQKFVDLKDDPDFRRWIRDRHQEEIDKLGVVCFSEAPDDIPMWSHYSDSHQGVCLRFGVSWLLEILRDNYTPMRVTYTEGYPEVGFYRDNRFRRTQLTVATKSKVWEHEREWRLVNQEGDRHFVFDPSALDGIIMGCRMPPADEARVREMVSRRSPQIELLKARPAERAFKLNIVSA